MVKIDNWSTCPATNDPFVAPECRGLALQGNVQDHPVLGVGFVHTSPIDRFHKRTVTTYSGTVYRLGRIDPQFRRYLRRIRPNWNWREPFTNLTTGGHER